MASLAVVGAGVFAVPQVFARSVGNIYVEFQNTPLFYEANFLPGEGVTRWIKVTNYSGSTQKIAIETINEVDLDNLASQMNLVIKKGAAVLYNNTLQNFFNVGEVYLSDVTNGSTTQYDLTITFNPLSGNEYQETRLGFDILIGFQGTEGGVSGGGLPPGLTIYNEALIQVATTSATINWWTNYDSTSWVIYAANDPYTFDLSQPNYGYTYSSVEDPNKVKIHSVTITGLTPGTTYHYRCVSHASLAVGTEHTFSTLALAGNGISGSIGDDGATGGTSGTGGNGGVGDTNEVSVTENNNGQDETKNEDGTGNILVSGVADDNGGATVQGTDKGTENETDGEENEGFNFNNLLASIGGLFSLKNLWWTLFILSVVLVFFIFLLRKRKEKEPQPQETKI